MLIAGEYKCLSPSLAVYLMAARNLLAKFREATWEHISREENFAANEMAQIATGIQMPEDCVQRIIKVGKKSLPSVLTRGMEMDVNAAILTEEDWRLPIINYLQCPTLPSEKRIRIIALNYLMWNGDLVNRSKDMLASQISRPGIPGRGDVREHDLVIRMVRNKHSSKSSCNWQSLHQPLNQSISCVPMARGAELSIWVMAEICRDLWGSHHHASR
ncbi:unnamed protein product, partial [Prunus brigantina]